MPSGAANGAADAERLADRPRGVPGDLRAVDDVARDRGDDRVHDRCGHVADGEQVVDRAERQRAGADEPLSGVRELEDLRARRDALRAPAERLGRAVGRVALVKHRLDGACFFERGELLARDVLGGAVGA